MKENRALQAILLVCISIFLLLAIVIYQKFVFEDGKLHIVFCDVGQGDAIFIKTPGNAQLLIDGGPDNAVLDCLSAHMPFWDRHIESVFLTHPHADHLSGLIDVIERYSILYFFESSVKVETQSEGMEVLSSAIREKGVPKKMLASGDRLSFSNQLSLFTLWPEGEVAKGVTDINDTSLVLLLSYKDFTVLLTGDAGANTNYYRRAEARDSDILKVPHHGSRTGLNEEFLNNVKPDLAIVSVGEKNSYGHPSEDVMKLLRDKDIKTLRTDKDGEIEIVSDGKAWSVKTENPGLLTK